MEWHTEKRKISELKVWDRNPRTISTDSYNRLKRSIEERGFHDILKIDENNVVLSGNQRLQALKELGYTEVECKVSDEILTDEQKDQIAVESNYQDGQWDMDKLANEFSETIESLGIDDLIPNIEYKEGAGEDELKDFLDEQEDAGVVKIFTREDIARKIEFILEKQSEKMEIDDKGLVLYELIKEYETLY